MKLSSTGAVACKASVTSKLQDYRGESGWLMECPPFEEKSALPQARCGHRRPHANRDSLTGAFNRHRMDTFSTRLVADALSKANDLSIVLLDIDHFKRINDTHGHDAGDAVLKRFAELVHKQLRTSDAFFRLG